MPSGLTHELQSDIMVNKRLCGRLRVFYPEDKPFLIPEEQRLIDAVAGDLGKWLEGKRLEQTLISLAEEHQHTIGRELHDNLGQQIAAIGYQAEALEQDLAASGSPEAAQVAASIARQAQGAVERCKEMAHGLLPFELETHGLMNALQALATGLRTSIRSAVNSSARMILSLKIIRLRLTFIGLHRKRSAMRYVMEVRIISSFRWAPAAECSICRYATTAAAFPVLTRSMAPPWEWELKSCITAPANWAPR